MRGFDTVNLHDTLMAIWKKYDPQRQAEADAMATAAKARDALATLNRERAAMGLAPVGEYCEQGLQALQMQAQANYFMPGPKTWRDELDASLLAAVKTYCEQSL